jgi:23S rRNA-/tRNA-specific pseudouridylate synthase
LKLTLDSFFCEKKQTVHTSCQSQFRSWGKGAKEIRPFVSQVNPNSEGKTRKPYSQKKASAETYTTELTIVQLEQENVLDSIKKYTNIQENLLGSIKNHKVWAVDCSLYRGFRHQARVHLAWCGLPIIGDTLYGWRKTNNAENFERESPLPSLDDSQRFCAQYPMLFFAVKITFTHPATGKCVEYSIDICEKG